MEVKGKLVTKSFVGIFQPRVVTLTNPLDPVAINIDNTDLTIIEGLVQALVINSPLGTPVEGQRIRIRIKDSGATQTITWGADFRGEAISLPTDTIAGQTMYIEVEWNNDDFKWDVINAGCCSDGGGGAAIYAESLTSEFTTQIIEGITIGNQIDHRVEERDGRLHLVLGDPYVAPNFTAFSIANQPTVIEAGNTISAGNRTFNWSTNDPGGNITPNTITIRDETGATDLATGLANDGTELVNIGAAPITLLNGQNRVYNITSGQLQGSDISYNFTVSAYWKVFWGNNPGETIGESEIEAFTSNLIKANFNGSYSFTAEANNYKWLCFPEDYGLATTFTDTATNFDVAMNTFGANKYITVPVTNAFGQLTNYRCYRTFNQLGGAITINVS
jgi:hypothetical protein